MSSGTSRLPDAVLRGLVFAAAAVVIISGLRAASSLLVPLVFASFLATVSYPLVQWLARRRIPTPLAVVATLGSVIAILLGPGLVIHRAATQFASVAPRYQVRLRDMTAESFELLQARGIDTSRLDAVFDSAAIIDLVGVIFSGLAILLSNAFLVLLVMAFALLEAAGLPRKLRDALDYGPGTIERFQRAAEQIQRYLRVKTLVSLVTGVLAGALTAAIGIDFAVLWGLLAFMLNYIPTFGSIMAAVPPVLLAMLQYGPGPAIGIALGFAGINVLLGNITEPLLMGRHLRLSPLVILLSLVFWGWVWGPVGMLLAVPITMVVKIFLEHSPDLKWVAVLMGDGRAAPPPPRVPASAREDTRGVA